MTNALNPKATIFLAIFTTLVSPTTPMKVQFALWDMDVASIHSGSCWSLFCFFFRPVVRQQFLKDGKTV